VTAERPSSPDPEEAEGGGGFVKEDAEEEDGGEGGGGGFGGLEDKATIRTIRAKGVEGKILMHSHIQAKDVYQRQQGEFPLPSFPPYFSPTRSLQERERERAHLFVFFVFVQDTLIVWTEPDGTDIALSFADPDDCENVWEFVLEVQKMLDSGRCWCYPLLLSSQQPASRSEGGKGREEGREGRKLARELES